MDLNWKDLAGKVVGLGAPMLGQALGGPLGGAAGKILADALGATDATPQAVNAAIAERSADSAFVSDAARKAEADWAAALATEAEAAKVQLTQVGETMRAEASSGDVLQRWWRPLYALEMTLFECPGFALVLGHALWSGKADTINGLANLSGLIMTYMAARFGVLGVYVSGRSREKQAAAAGEVIPSVLGEVLKVVAKRR